MSAARTVMVVDDEPSMLRYLRTLLELDSYAVEAFSSGNEALQRIHSGLIPDVVLLDLLMPDMDGLETLTQLRALHPRAKVVMLSCVSDTRKVAHAIRLGACDYLSKPFEKAALDAALKQCFDAHEQVLSPEAGPGDIEEVSEDLYFVAAGPVMRRIRAQVGLVAKVDVPLLLLGESGTGKEVLAHLIHRMSARAHRTFLKVNCAALPADLLESELFGYEPGAFTGANRAKPGKFELCNKGTILLDEIGEMPPQLQAKLLHVLQDQQFSRLGSRSMVKVDVRILAATNINIEEALATRKLREDLYYRLNAFTIQLPPLRDRRDEIPLLLKHFMSNLAERYGRPPLPITAALQQACVRHHWPGNLRELGNFVKRYLVLGDEELALAELEPRNNGNGRSLGAPLPRPAGDTGDLKSMVRSLKDEAEMQAIASMLEQTGWNRKEAALRLNISYKALLYKIRQYGIDQPQGQRARAASA